MTPLYPILLDVRDVRILVVGGGAVAARKTEALVELGGRPDVVAPELHPEFAALVERARLSWRARGYVSGDATGYELVFAATDHRVVNAAVAEEARRGGAWVNVVDDPAASTFQVPASLREGDVTVAFSTGGAAPLLARRLRERFEGIVTPGLGRAVERLRVLREQVRTRWPEDEERRRAFWFRLITHEFLDSAISGQDEQVETRIETCLSQS